MEIDEGKVCSLNNQCANGFLMCFFLFLFLTSVIIIIRFSIYLAKTKTKTLDTALHTKFLIPHTIFNLKKVPVMKI